MKGHIRNGSRSISSDAHASHPPDGNRRPFRGTGTFGPLLALLAILLCGFAALAWADSSGPIAPNITLDVHNYPSNGSDGYINTTASNGAIYSYRYTGGENGGGDVVFHTRGRVTVNVSLSNDSDYSIEDVSFRGDTNDQLSWLTNQGGPTTAVIQDVNDTVQDARYKITVRGDDDVTVPCDPIMANRT